MVFSGLEEPSGARGIVVLRVLSLTTAFLAIASGCSRWEEVEETRFGQFMPIFSIGQLEGPSHLVLGRIEDVTFGDGAGIFLLDSSPPSVHAYSSDGKHLASWEARGRGPGEMMAPQELEVTREGRIAIADRVRLVLIVLEFRDNKFFHVVDHPIPGLPHAMCVTGGSAIVLVGSDIPLFEIDLSTGQAKALPIRGEENPHARGGFSAGHLACPAADRLGAWGGRFTGRLRLFGPDGTVHEDFGFPGFRSIDTVTVGRKFVQSLPEEGFTTLDHVGWVDDSTLVLQGNEYAQHGGRVNIQETVSFLKRPGAPVVKLQGWPSLTVFQAGRGAGVVQDSVPRVHVYSWTGGHGEH